MATSSKPSSTTNRPACHQSSPPSRANEPTLSRLPVGDRHRASGLCCAVACHTEGMGITRTLTPDEFWSMVQDSNDRVRASFKDYPLFAPAQWSGTVMLGQWSFSGDGPRGLMHGLLQGSEPFIHIMTCAADACSSAMTLRRRTPRVSS